MKPILPTFLALACVLSACDRGPTLETRTFSLTNLEGGEALELIRPYVFEDRPASPGAMSGIDRAITVRETSDNLDKIARVLDEFDADLGVVELRFRLIEAGNIPTSGDLGVALEQLERLFDHQGYRLRGEAFFMTDGSEASLSQSFTGSAANTLTAEVYRSASGVVRLQDVRLWENDSDVLLNTSINIRPGQTLILGGSPDGGGTLFLAVEARQSGG